MCSPLCGCQLQYVSQGVQWEPPAESPPTHTVTSQWRRFMAESPHLTQMHTHRMVTACKTRHTDGHCSPPCLRSSPTPFKSSYTPRPGPSICSMPAPHRGCLLLAPRACSDTVTALQHAGPSRLLAQVDLAHHLHALVQHRVQDARHSEHTCDTRNTQYSIQQAALHAGLKYL